VLRDASGDIAMAFEQAVSGVLRLLDRPPERLRAEVLENATSSNAKTLRRLVWRFLRDHDQGLPSATRSAVASWFPSLKANAQRLLSDIEAIASLKRTSSWANNLTKRNLTVLPLWEADLFSRADLPVRIDTVHKAKGEGFAAVIYAALPADVRAFVGGTGNEEGRIGYVALTRAKDLFLLAVPTSTKKHLITDIESLGIVPWGF
jgi:superfamily I DNA/RNA helicase